MSRAAWRRVQTAAKINLALCVGRVGADGYHPVETVLQTIDLGDELALRTDQSGRLSLEVRGPVPTGPVIHNLVFRAATLFLESCKRPRTGPTRPLMGVALRLVKRVPAGAGLGGGSGDAAAALLLLNRCLDRPLSYRTLVAVARRLGADVPFFLRGGLACARGHGDRLRQLEPLPTLAVAVIVPPFALSTPQVYQRFDKLSLTSGRSQFTMRPVLRRLRSRSSGGSLLNDLQRPAFKEFPVLAAVVDDLRHRGALLAGLSGSGSAVFALFIDTEAMERCLRDWHRPGWQMLACRTLDGPSYRARFD